MHNTLTEHFQNKSIIDHLVSSVAGSLEESCETIILYGSGATNSLSYRVENNKLVFFSDLEFVVIPRKIEHAYNRSFRKHLMDKAESCLAANDMILQPPFIDVNPVARDFFEKAQCRISVFELKNLGKVLCGKNYLELLPDVNIRNYVQSIQNIEIVKGLKVLLLTANEWYFHKDYYSKFDREKYHYFLCSSYLNILRTLLPFMGYFCLSNRERVETITRLKNESKLGLFFTEEMIDKFWDALKCKESGVFSQEPDQLFLLVIAGYSALLRLLLNTTDDIYSAIEMNKQTLFGGWGVKKNDLASLCRFFMSSLNSIAALISYGHITDAQINETKSFFDNMLCGENANTLIQILDKYRELERERWQIIGSKD